MRAAVLWAGEDAVAHGVSATWWHDLGPALPAMVEVTVRRGRNPGKQLGVSVRRRDLSYPDLVAVRDLWVTDLPLTVLEAAIALGPEGSELLDRSLQRRVKFPAVCRAQCRNHGRRGSAQAAQLLAVAADRAASLAERVLVRLLRAAGITEWKLGYPVLGYVADLAFPAQRVAIEVDGWAWHVTVDRFVDDRRRQNALVNHHWTVLRFTWHDLVARPDGVVEEIRSALKDRDHGVYAGRCWWTTDFGGSRHAEPCRSSTRFGRVWTGGAWPSSGGRPGTRNERLNSGR
ncbi:MAG: DUF559 domain-containing protein [Pseudonocardiaceae bacterium]